MCTTSVLVNLVERLLYMDTAYSEYTLVMDKNSEADECDVRLACFQGRDLHHLHCDETATKLADQEDDKNE